MACYSVEICHVYFIYRKFEQILREDSISAAFCVPITTSVSVVDESADSKLLMA
jgi:hypothetical protein